MIEHVTRVHFSSRAAWFVQMLRDFGHLHDREGELMVRVIEAAVAEGRTLVDLELVRKVTSELIFEQQHGEADLAADWPLLFN